MCHLVFFSREKVDKKFIDACVYVKDRMEEVPSPDKEMVSISSGCCSDSLQLWRMKDYKVNVHGCRSALITVSTRFWLCIFLSKAGKMMLHSINSVASGSRSLTLVSRIAWYRVAFLGLTVQAAQQPNQ